MASRWQRTFWVGIALVAAGLSAACNTLPGLRNPAATPAAGQPRLAGANQAPALPELASLPVSSAIGAAVDAGQPLVDTAGKPLTSGLARVSAGQAELISRQGDESSLEWAVYGLTGLDATQQPASLKLTLAKVDGTVQVGISDYSSNLWHWKYISAAGLHELPLAGITPVSPEGNCYLVLGVSAGSTAVFTGALLNGAAQGQSADAPTDAPTDATPVLAQGSAPVAATPASKSATPPVETSGPANTSANKPAPATSVTGTKPAAAKPASAQSAFANNVGPLPPQPAKNQPSLVDEAPVVVGTNTKLVIPLAFPLLKPYDLPTQYRRLAGVVDPSIPAEDSAGWPLSSGMARFGRNRIHLTSINNDAHSVEWVVYGGSGFSPQTPPSQLALSFDRIDGGVWVGLPNYTADRFDWQLIKNAGPQAISLEGKNVVRQDGEMYFALGVCGGNYAEFSGGVVEEGTGVDLLGAYLSHGYWEADKMDAIFSELQSLGVNFVVDYALRWPSDAEWQDEFNSYLLSAQRHGIRLGYCLFPALAGATPEDAEAQFTKALDEVYLLRGNPAIAAWYVHDEVLPMVAGEGGTEHYTLSLKQMQDLYGKIHEADPGRPQINTWTQVPSRKQYNELFSANNLPFGREMWMDRDTAYEQTMQAMVRTTCDWVFVDEYPVGAPWVEPGTAPADVVKATVSRLASLRTTTQPLYFVFQSFSHAQYGRGAAESAVFPTAEQMREMLFASRLHGAQGALAYSWFDLTRTDLPGRDVPGRAQCLADLRQVLLEMDETGWPVPVAQAEPAGSAGKPAKK
jgi:hypothetical protein